jgi:PII-like signaling protein
MHLEGHHKRLTIFVGESDHHGHTPLAVEIVQRAHRAGLAGATVLRGVEGTAPPTTSTRPASCRSPTTCRWR